MGVGVCTSIREVPDQRVFRCLAAYLCNVPRVCQTNVLQLSTYQNNMCQVSDGIPEQCVTGVRSNSILEQCVTRVNIPEQCNVSQVSVYQSSVTCISIPEQCVSGVSIPEQCNLLQVSVYQSSVTCISIPEQCVSGVSIPEQCNLLHVSVYQSNVFQVSVYQSNAICYRCQYTRAMCFHVISIPEQRATGIRSNSIPEECVTDVSRSEQRVAGIRQYIRTACCRCMAGYLTNGYQVSVC